MNVLRSLWLPFVSLVYWLTLLLTPRAVFWGESPPETERPADAAFRVSAWAWIWVLMAGGVGVFLLTPYPSTRGAWLLVKLSGVVLAALGAGAAHVLLNTRVECILGELRFTRAGAEQCLKLDQLSGVYSTPGFIHVLRDDGTRLVIPKLFANGARLLAWLRHQRPDAARMT